jgi:hypothetical protein
MTTGSSQQACLIVFLQPILGLVLAEQWPIRRIRQEGQVYEPVGPDWSGFYDWLRGHESVLVGVRYHPCDETKFVLASAAHLDYARLGEHEDVSFFLTRHRLFDESRSDDQDILYNQVLTSGTGQIAICFAKDRIDPLELAALRSAEASWLHAQVEY